MVFVAPRRNEPQWGDYYWINMVKLCQGFLGEGQEVENRREYFREDDCRLRA